VGGYAVALHGAIRGTVDVDLVINWTLKNLQNIEKVFKEIGLVSLIPIHADNLYNFRDQYIQERHLIEWDFYDPHKPSNQVDIGIHYDLRGSHTDTVKTPSGNIRILSRKDLIKMKKTSGRPQDLEDVKSLENL